MTKNKSKNKPNNSNSISNNNNNKNNDHINNNNENQHIHDKNSYEHSHEHIHDNNNNNNEYNEDEEKEELEHYQLIVSTLLNYSQYSLHWVKDMQDFFHYKLSEEEKKLLPNYNAKMEALARAVLVNSQFLKKIGNEHCNIFSQSDNSSNYGSGSGERIVDPTNLDHIKIDYFMMDQLKSTIRQLVREWSEEGKVERDQAFEPIKQQLLEIYGHIPFQERSKIRVYSPGAGLGRLCLEIASLGFSSQGIEYSFMMLIVSNFMLNKVEKVNEFKIHPYIHQTVNVLRDIDQLRTVMIPDVLSSELLPKNNPGLEFSMSAGDFTKNIEENSFDCICTCFFIDTAPNILEYVDCISKILKPGGTWINFGPLLYHHAKKKDSIELSYEQLRYLICKKQFQFKKEEIRDAEYCSNQKSLLRSVYKCQFFVVINNKTYT
ncbi:hypothetical protein ACTFIV_011034 [Dictyostelium citrinum]